MTQKEIVKLAQQGNEDAFCTLYEQIKDKLYRYAYYRLSDADDAEDAVSDAVMSAYIQMKELRNPDAYTQWMFRILSAACNKYIRQQIMRRETADVDELVHLPSGERPPDGTQTEVQRALALLSEQDREIVLLSAVSGFNSKEIAKITGFSSVAVRSRLSRALAKMRNALE